MANGDAAGTAEETHSESQQQHQQQQQSSPIETMSRSLLLSSTPPVSVMLLQQQQQQGLYHCHICTFTGQVEAEFKEHMLCHYNHVCPQCDYASKTEGRLRRHIREFHTPLVSRRGTGQPKLLRCRQCPFVATDKVLFWQHSAGHIKVERMQRCPHCPFVTEYKHHLEYHLRNHSGSKPFQCTKCNYSCVNKSMLNSHMKSHTNVYQYRCADCTFATKYCHSLRLHLDKTTHSAAAVLNPDGSLPAEVKDIGEFIRRGDRQGARPRSSRTRRQRCLATNRSPDKTDTNLEASSVQPQHLYQPTSFSQLMSLPLHPLMPIMNMTQMPGLPPATGASIFPLLPPPPPYLDMKSFAICKPEVRDDVISAPAYSPRVDSGGGGGGGGGWAEYLQSMARNASLFSSLFNAESSHYHALKPLPTPPYAVQHQQLQQQASPSPSWLLSKEAMVKVTEADSSPPIRPELPNIDVASTEVKAASAAEAYAMDEEEISTELQQQQQDEADDDNVPLDLSTQSRSFQCSSQGQGDSETTTAHSSSSIASPLQVADLSCNKNPLDIGLCCKSEKTAIDLDIAVDKIQLPEAAAPKKNRRRKGTARKVNVTVANGTYQVLSGEHGTRSQPRDRWNGDEQLSKDNVLDLGPATEPSTMTESAEETVSPGIGDSDTCHSLGTPESGGSGWLYECQHCLLSFRDYVMYILHKGYHGYEDPFCCNLCGQTCKNRVDFFIHIAQVAHE